MVSSAADITATNNIVFDTVKINVNSAFNVTTQLVPDSGVFWFQLAAGVPANSGAYMQLQDQSPTIFSNNTAFPYECMVADAIQNISSVTPIRASSQTTLNGYQNRYVGTSLAGFRLDNIMSSLICFAVQLSQDIPGCDGGTLVAFDRVLMNIGGGWNTTPFTFKAPIAGIYYISFATSSADTTRAMMSVRVNGATNGTVCMCDMSHNGVQVARGALLLQLTTTDVVTFVNPDSNIAVRGSPEGLTSAQGFLYAPTLDISSVAWSVVKTGPGKFTNSSVALQYDTAVVNTNNVFNLTASHVIIPVDGTYLVDLTAYICGNGPPLNCTSGQPGTRVELTGFYACVHIRAANQSQAAL